MPQISAFSQNLGWHRTQELPAKPKCFAPAGTRSRWCEEAHATDDGNLVLTVEGSLDRSRLNQPRVIWVDSDQRWVRGDRLHEALLRTVNLGDLVSPEVRIRLTTIREER